MVKLLTTQQVAEMVGRSVGALAQDRCAGTGLPYIKLGALVRYDPDDVQNYLRQKKVQPIG